MDYQRISVSSCIKTKSQDLLFSVSVLGPLAIIRKCAMILS